MARRASSSSPNFKILAASLAAAGCLLTGYLLFSGTPDSLRTTSPLPVKDYLENASSLRGNTYRLEALIDKTLEVAADSGRLFSVETGSDMLPLFVPSKLNGINIERGQKFLFRVQINEKGLIVASDVRKP